MFILNGTVDWQESGVCFKIEYPCCLIKWISLKFLETLKKINNIPIC